MSRPTDRQPITVDRHAEFRRGLYPEPLLPFDEIDEAAADPVLDHLPQRRGSRGAGRIFQILDELETGRPTV